MAEILGIVGSLGSLVALSKDTVQACNKLAKLVRTYRKAATEAAALSDELSDLSKTIDLIQDLLGNFRDRSDGFDVAALQIDKTLIDLQKDFQIIEEATAAVSHHNPASHIDAKQRFHWVFKKAEITTVMPKISRKHQTLRTKLQIMHM